MAEASMVCTSVILGSNESFTVILWLGSLFRGPSFLL